MPDLLNMSTVSDLQSLADAEDPDFFRETVQAFEANAKELLDQLETIIDASDGKRQLPRLLHQLKGSSYNVGAQALGDLSEQYEQQGKIDPAGIEHDEMVRELRQTFQRTMQAYKQLEN